MHTTTLKQIALLGVFAMVALGVFGCAAAMERQEAIEELIQDKIREKRQRGQSSPDEPSRGAPRQVPSAK